MVIQVLAQKTLFCVCYACDSMMLFCYSVNWCMLQFWFLYDFILFHSVIYVSDARHVNNTSLWIFRNYEVNQDYLFDLQLFNRNLMFYNDVNYVKRLVFQPSLTLHYHYRYYFCCHHYYFQLLLSIIVIVIITSVIAHEVVNKSIIMPITVNNYKSLYISYTWRFSIVSLP